MLVALVCVAVLFIMANLNNNMPVTDAIFIGLAFVVLALMGICIDIVHTIKANRAEKE